MNMGGMPNKILIQGQQINQIQNMQSNPMLSQINQINQNTIGQQMVRPPGQPHQMGNPQINVSQIGSNQMQSMQVIMRQ